MNPQTSNEDKGLKKEIKKIKKRLKGTSNDDFGQSMQQALALLESKLEEAGEQPAPAVQPPPEELMPEEKVLKNRNTLNGF